MAILLLSIFLAIVAVDIWAALLVIFGRNVRRWLSRSYFIVVPLAFIAAFLVTSFFSYSSNPNPHVYGWPVPRVIFQRDTPTSPWLDYIGPTIVLAYPMNFILYMFVPSVAAIVFILVWRRRDRKRRPNTGLEPTATAS
jgi:hypothetical protein